MQDIVDKMGHAVHMYWRRARWNDLADQLVAAERRQRAIKLEAENEARLRADALAQYDAVYGG